MVFFCPASTLVYINMTLVYQVMVEITNFSRTHPVLLHAYCISIVKLMPIFGTVLESICIRKTSPETHGFFVLRLTWYILICYLVFEMVPQSRNGLEITSFSVHMFTDCFNYILLWWRIKFFFFFKLYENINILSRLYEELYTFKKI